jgi:hypothetical protein
MDMSLQICHWYPYLSCNDYWGIFLRIMIVIIAFVLFCVKNTTIFTHKVQFY